MGVQLDTGGDKKVKPNINVTPLVDVVLVLLIIFMLVIPNMQEGVPIDLFQANNAIKDEDDAEPLIVALAIDKDSQEVAYYIGDEQHSKDGLIAEVAKAREADAGLQILFRGDSRIEYAKVREVFLELQNMNIAYIQLAVGAQKESWEE